MEIRENGSFAQIWLTTEEQKNAAIKEVLPALIKQYKKKGYFPVVYRSGDKEHTDGIRDLLLYNKKIASERENHTGC